MTVAKWLVVGMVGLGVLALGAPEAQAITVAAYTESGDAGDLSNPQLLTGGPYNVISGDIGGTDLVDVFGFFWAGGEFHIQAIYTGIETIHLSLFDAAKNLEGVALSTAELTYPDLEPGSYFLKIATSTSVDPPFTIGILPGPTTVSGNFQAFVPAPPALALVLLGGGLVGLASRVRRRHRASAR